MTSRTEYNTPTRNKPSLFDVQYLRNHRTLDIGVLGYIGIVWPKEHSPEVRSFPPVTPCILPCYILSNSVDFIKVRNDFQCFVINSSLLTGHFPYFRTLFLRSPLCVWSNVHWLRKMVYGLVSLVARTCCIFYYLKSVEISPGFSMSCYHSHEGPEGSRRISLLFL